MRIGYVDFRDSDYDGRFDGEEVIFPVYTKGGRGLTCPREQFDGTWSVRADEYIGVRPNPRVRDIGEEEAHRNGFGTLYDLVEDACKHSLERKDPGYGGQALDMTATGRNFIRYLVEQDAENFDNSAKLISLKGYNFPRLWKPRYVITSIDRGGYKTYEQVPWTELLPDVTELDKWVNWPNDPSIFSISTEAMSMCKFEEQGETSKEDIIERMEQLIDNTDDGRGFYVYVIKLLRDNELWWYVGQTINPIQRLKTHLQNKNVVGVDRLIGVSNRDAAKEKERKLAYEVAIEKNSTNILGGR